jgi:hypothetical protein
MLACKHMLDRYYIDIEGKLIKRMYKIIDAQGQEFSDEVFATKEDARASLIAHLYFYCHDDDYTTDDLEAASL